MRSADRAGHASEGEHAENRREKQRQFLIPFWAGVGESQI